MARYYKEIMRKVYFIKCDFCRYYVELDAKFWTSGAINECDLCGKDVCISCTGEACEDGQLCKGCSENHYFHSSLDEGVGIINRETGEDVDWHMDKLRKSGIGMKHKLWNTKESDKNV